LRSLPEDAVRLLVNAKAVPVLAHPLTTGDIDGILRRLAPLGLAGIEVYYGEYDEATRRQLAEIAAAWSLIPTGGSDYHGPGFKEGRDLGSVSVPPAALERLYACGRNSRTRAGP
jgi:predicted metal-dependent phosphoesterase TrpH